MNQKLAIVTYLVNDYDEAIEFFTDKLGFTLKEDNERGNGKRWVKVAPVGVDGIGLLLAKATNDEQKKTVRNQTGRKVAFFCIPIIFGVIIKT